MQEHPRTSNSFEQVVTQTQQSHTSKDSLHWQKELFSWDTVFINKEFWHNSAKAYAHRFEGYARAWAWGCGNQQFRLLMYGVCGQHSGVFLRVALPPPLLSHLCFPHQKDPTGPLWLPLSKPGHHRFPSVASFIKGLSHMPRIIAPKGKGSVWKDTIFSFKQRFPSQHFCHDATDRPDIHCLGRKREKKAKREWQFLGRKDYRSCCLLFQFSTVTDFNFTPIFHPPLPFLCC